MANNLAKKGQKMAFKVLYIQSVVVLLVSIPILLILDYQTALAFLFGGSMNIIPSGIFAFFAFRFSGASQIQLVVRSFTQGVKLKLFITVIMVVVAFAGLNLTPLPVFTGFIVSIFCQRAAMIKTQD